MYPARPRFMMVAIALLVAALVALLLYTAVLGWLWFKQENLLFAPEVLPADRPLAMAPDVHEVSIDVPGARLSALHLRLPNPRGVVFFLHGNGGSLSNWFVNPEYYRRVNVDLFMIDYRGYGKSTGRIESEAQLHDDVRAAWATVAPLYRDRKIVIYGRSLGTGLAASLAVELSATRPPDLTVLVSPYTSMVDLTRAYYRWVPPFVLRYPLRTDALIGRIKGPVLLIHGANDALISPAHSDALKLLAPQATVLRIPGAAHNDLQDFDAYLEAFARALSGL